MKPWVPESSSYCPTQLSDRGLNKCESFSWPRQLSPSLAGTMLCQSVHAKHSAVLAITRYSRDGCEQGNWQLKLCAGNSLWLSANIFQSAIDIARNFKASTWSTQGFQGDRIHLPEMEKNLVFGKNFRGGGQHEVRPLSLSSHHWWPETPARAPRRTNALAVRRPEQVRIHLQQQIPAWHLFYCFLFTLIKDILGLFRWGKPALKCDQG